MKRTDYLQKRLTYIKALKAPTEQQQLLLLLAEKPDRSADENKQLAILLTAEQATDRAKTAQLQAAKLLGQRKDAARKARNHYLILQGLLLDLAGLNDWDRGELLGALLALQESQNVPPERRQQWKQRGDALLAEKAQEGSKREKSDIPAPPPDGQAVAPPAPTSTGTFTPRPDRDRL
jgi:Conjugal transfer protein TraD